MVLDPVSVLGLALAVPMSVLATRISMWQEERRSEEEVREICRLAVGKATDDLRNPENILGRSYPKVNFGEDRRSRIIGVLLENDGIRNFAAMIEDPPTGKAREHIEQKLIDRLKRAMDLPAGLAEEGNDIAFDLILLIAHHMETGFFEPFLVDQRYEQHRALAIADEVQRRLERPADPYDVDLYLQNLIEAVSTDLTHRLALSPLTSDDIHRRLSVETGAERTINAERVMDEFDRVLMYGEPGSGKSWIAQRIALNAARECQKLREQGQPVSSMEIPVFTTCSLLEKGHDFYGTITENSVFARWPDPERARRLLREDQTLLVIGDSYDESTGGDQLRQHLDSLDRRANTRLLVTSRPASVPANIAQMFTSPPSQKEWDPAKVTAHLLPMDEDESANLRSSLAKGMRLDIEGLAKWFESGHLREMTRNPLLSVLSVLAFSQDCEPPSSVPELYDRAIRRIVRLEARRSRAGRRSWTHIEVDHNISRWMDALTAFAWNAQSVLQPSERFEILDVIPVAELSTRCNAVGLNADEERLALSLLTRSKGYTYLHRTIQEQLIARYAAATFDSNVQYHLEFWPPWSEIAPSVLVQVSWAASMAWWSEALPGSNRDLQAERLRLVCRLAKITTRTFWCAAPRSDLQSLLSRSMFTWLRNHSRSPLEGAVSSALVIIVDEIKRQEAIELFLGMTTVRFEPRDYDLSQIGILTRAAVSFNRYEWEQFVAELRAL